jgi:nicotinamidase-related amidase
MGDQLLSLPVIERSVHLCVDIQRIFSDEGPWPTPWMDRVLPVVASLASRNPERTVLPASFPQASRRDAGHVAAVLHTLARCDPVSASTSSCWT